MEKTLKKVIEKVLTKKVKEEVLVEKGFDPELPENKQREYR